MLNKLLFIAVSFMFFSHTSLAAMQQVDFVRAYAEYDLDSVRNIAKSIAQKAFKSKLGEPFSPMTFTNFGAGSVYYALYDDLLIRKFDIAKDEFIAQWRLNNYPDLVIEHEAKEHGIDLVYQYIGSPGVGCLMKYPLRHADVDHDGQRELLLLFSGDTQSQANMVIFSPEKGKVIFASVLSADLAMDSSPQTLDDYYHTSGMTAEYQYSYDEGGQVPMLSRGYRTFGKLFFGDINDDGVQDIILWRKYFESLKTDDPKRGFVKQNELWVHYAMQQGEYKKQPTRASTIRAWLAAKQLTWQQGFPNRSECPEEEGQVIPEFHDRLLNDPDVLH